MAFFISCQSDNEKFIQGTWYLDGSTPQGLGWYKKWSFKNGKYRMTGYPPIDRFGSYKKISETSDAIEILLKPDEKSEGQERKINITLNREDQTISFERQEYVFVKYFSSASS